MSIASFFSPKANQKILDQKSKSNTHSTLDSIEEKENKQEKPTQKPSSLELIEIKDSQSQEKETLLNRTETKLLKPPNLSFLTEDESEEEENTQVNNNKLSLSKDNKSKNTSNDKIRETSSGVHSESNQSKIIEKAAEELSKSTTKSLDNTDSSTQGLSQVMENCVIPGDFTDESSNDRIVEQNTKPSSVGLPSTTPTEKDKSAAEVSVQIIESSRPSTLPLPGVGETLVETVTSVVPSVGQEIEKGENEKDATVKSNITVSSTKCKNSKRHVSTSKSVKRTQQSTINNDQAQIEQEEKKLKSSNDSSTPSSVSEESSCQQIMNGREQNESNVPTRNFLHATQLEMSTCHLQAFDNMTLPLDTTICPSLSARAGVTQAAVPTQAPPTQVPPTQVPPTQVPPTQIPPTQPEKIPDNTQIQGSYFDKLINNRNFTDNLDKLKKKEEKIAKAKCTQASSSAKQLVSLGSSSDSSSTSSDDDLGYLQHQMPVPPLPNQHHQLSGLGLPHQIQSLEKPPSTNPNPESSIAMSTLTDTTETTYSYLSLGFYDNFYFNTSYKLQLSNQHYINLQVRTKTCSSKMVNFKIKYSEISVVSGFGGDKIWRKKMEHVFGSNYRDAACLDGLRNYGEAQNWILVRLKRDAKIDQDLLRYVAAIIFHIFVCINNFNPSSPQIAPSTNI